MVSPCRLLRSNIPLQRVVGRCILRTVHVERPGFAAMGKTRGHGSRRPGRGRGRGRGGAEDSDEEEYETQRGLGGQSNTVGMLPPSDDSDDEDADDEKEKQPAAAEKPAASKQAGQPKTAGMLPPSDSDEDEDDEEEEEESSEEEPLPEYLAQPSAPKRKKQQEEDEPDPEQIRKDLERLEMIKNKREQDRLKRIAEEGWDRFAPVSETNKPPGSVPTDHPSRKEDD